MEIFIYKSISTFQGCIVIRNPVNVLFFYFLFLSVIVFYYRVVLKLYTEYVELTFSFAKTIY
jgi:predicted acyltransferase (DUF342 family)